jgi:hypothetical protein
VGASPLQVQLQRRNPLVNTVTKGHRIQGCKHTALGVMRREAMLQGHKLAESVNFGLNELLNVGLVIGSSDDRARSRERHLHQIVLLIASGAARDR